MQPESFIIIFLKTANLRGRQSAEVHTWPYLKNIPTCHVNNYTVGVLHIK